MTIDRTRPATVPAMPWPAGWAFDVNDGGTPPAPAPEPAPSPVPEPAPAPPAPSPSPEPAPAPPAWTDGLDAASKSFAEARGFKGPAEVLAKLREFEPPESPDKYELPTPEGADPAYVAAMREAAHKAGVPAQYVKALAEAQNAYTAKQQSDAAEAAKNAETEAAALATRQKADLQREWGDTFDAKTEGARRAALAFTPGADEASKLEFLSAMETRFGYAGMMKFWAAIGDHMAEGKAHGLGGEPALRAASFYDKSNMKP